MRSLCSYEIVLVEGEREYVMELCWWWGWWWRVYTLINCVPVVVDTYAFINTFCVSNGFSSLTLHVYSIHRAAMEKIRHRSLCVLSFFVVSISIFGPFGHSNCMECRMGSGLLCSLWWGGGTHRPYYIYISHNLCFLFYITCSVWLICNDIYSLHAMILYCHIVIIFIVYFFLNTVYNPYM